LIEVTAFIFNPKLEIYLTSCSIAVLDSLAVVYKLSAKFIKLKTFSFSAVAALT
jgi:hypothetical protein